MHKVRRILATLVATVGLATATPLLVAPTVAGAAVLTETALNPARPIGGLTLSAFLYSMLTSVAIPIVTGVLGRLAGGRTGAKKVIAIVLSCVNGLVMAATFTAAGTAVISREAGVLAFVSLVTQLAVYLGVYDESSVKLAAEGKR